jgi:hypothetical protein
MLKILLTASALALAAPLAAAPPPVTTLTPAAARADVALMRRALEAIHPGLYRYRSKAEIDAAFARLEAVADSGPDSLALHRAVALMVAEIRCDHSKPEAGAAMDAWRRDNASHLPLRFTLLDGRMIVVSNDGQPGSPPRGAEILSINGRPVPVLLEALARTVAYDGDTVDAVAEKLASDSDLGGDDFNEYYPAFFGFPARWEIDWKRPGDAGVTRSALDPIPFRAWTKLPADTARQRAEFHNSIDWRLGGKVAVLRIDTFVNYRNPVDATAFLGGFFKTLKARGTPHLILDLRNNGGGSEDVSVALGRFLFDKPFLWGLPSRLKAVRYGDLPQHIESWGDRDALFNPPLGEFTRTADGWWDRTPTASDEASVTQDVLPEAERFTGKLTILTGAANGSGATRTIAQFKEKRGATLVGEDSSGSAEGPTAGQIFLLTLPNSGLKVRIPNVWNRTNIDRFVPGKGVAADIVVRPTLADFEAGRDRTLEVARADASAAAPPATAILATALAGSWTGRLDYRDYGTDARVGLPVTATVSPALDIAFTYDDGPGKTVRSSESWRIDPVTATIAVTTARGRPVKSRLTGLAQLSSAADVTLSWDGSATENGRAVETRTLLTVRGDRLRLTRMSRTPGGPFLLRSAHDLSRIARPAGDRTPASARAAGS